MRHVCKINKGLLNLSRGNIYLSQINSPSDMQPLTRRGLIAGAAALFCAPAIVRVGSLMPVKAWAELQSAGDLWLEKMEWPSTQRLIQIIERVYSLPRHVRVI